MEASFDANGVQIGWESPAVSALAVGPFDLLAGDLLDVRLTHELDNENPGNPAYYMHGLQHERGWAMASTGARIGTSVNPNAGSWVIPPQEQNWDWLVHHLGINRSAHYVVPSNLPGAYVYDRLYFKGGVYIGSYAPATPPPPEARRCQINSGLYPKLTVAVFRST